MTEVWQIHLFVPAAAPQPWRDDEAAEAWAYARQAWFVAGPQATVGWFGFRLGARTAVALADAIERWVETNGEDDLRGWPADLRELSNGAPQRHAEVVHVEPASYLPVALWTFTATSEAAALDVAARPQPIEHSIWEPGTVGFWIDIATAHMLLRVPWGSRGALSELREQLWSWLVDRDAERLSAEAQ